MAFSPDTPLDLYSLFFEQIAGTEALFMVASLFLIARFSAAMKFPNMVTISLFAVYGLIMGVIFSRVLIITMFVIGIFMFIILNKLFNK